MPLGILALMGSGEIGPSMTKVHRNLLNRLAQPQAISLDTPYGFQENVRQMTEKIVQYFDVSLTTSITPVPFQYFLGSSVVAREQFKQAVESSNYVFAGPGSPSFALTQWTPLDLGSTLKGVLQSGGVVCFSSAAALTTGRFTAPIYEIYKVGDAPYWLDGLNLLELAGLNAAVIPHFDNAEGANYDTSCCYIGRRRLDELIEQLPEGFSVLGIDEHTAAVIDLESATLEVLGKGTVHWISGSINQVFESGTTVPLGELGTGVPNSTKPISPVDPDSVEELAHKAGSGGSDAAAAIARLTTLATHGSESNFDPTKLIDALVARRNRARQEKDWALSDELRDSLLLVGIEIQDGADGTTWKRLN
jgi:peptidase E